MERPLEAQKTHVAEEVTVKRDVNWNCEKTRKG